MSRYLYSSPKWIGPFSSYVAALSWLLIPVQAVADRPVLPTRWTVSATNAHPEYPRPSMVRSEWLSLNGQWDFAVTRLAVTNSGPFTNRINVPFPAEAPLSGAKHPLFTERQRMWYRRQFAVPSDWHGQRILLHFEAVDWDTRVWINGREVGSHQGGYDRFTFDITDALRREETQELLVSVADPSDSGAQPRGKQMLHPTLPFFSAASGIWQTVWIEPVPPVSVESLKLVSDIDAGVLNIQVACRGDTDGVKVEAVVFDQEREVSRGTADPGGNFLLSIPDARLWSPERPFLYDLRVNVIRSGKTSDSVSSYFGMRSISIGKRRLPAGTNEVPCILLNDKPVFQWGPLDQGYWPDGIYTAPTDEALRYDIEVMKQFGFNMCRKHVKIEPERWYYWCDKLGLLVWQDMPNGGAPSNSPKESGQPPHASGPFEMELQRLITLRGNHPSIVVWTVFNQGWGQYDTARITDLVKQQDPSRLVISASGWHDMKTGDIASFHSYPQPTSLAQDGRRAVVVGECGAFGLVIRDHLWGGVARWNTTYFKDANEWMSAYTNLISSLSRMRDKDGISAAVITQLTDVEAELNGFMTYDRAVLKMPAEKVKQLNDALINTKIVTATTNRVANSQP